MIKNENYLRRLAKKQGLTLKKSRAQTFSNDNEGGYMIIDSSTNSIVYGDRWQLSLDDVEKYLSEYEEDDNDMEGE